MMNFVLKIDGFFNGAQFDAAFITALAAAFDVDVSAVVITGVTGASVRVSYAVNFPCGGDCAAAAVVAESANDALLETAEAGGFTVTGLGIASAVAEPPAPEPEPDTTLVAICIKIDEFCI